MITVHFEKERDAAERFQVITDHNPKIDITTDYAYSARIKDRIDRFEKRLKRVFADYERSGRVFVIKRMPKVRNHYGIWVDSETPTTGVVTNWKVEFLVDAMYYEGGINLTEIERCAECRAERKIEDPDEYDPECEICMVDGCQDTWIIGDWKLDEDGKYEPDKDGERGYSAIVGEIYTQVVWSKTTKRCALCSPCYPGQGSVDSPGDFLVYDLPRDLYGGNDDQQDS